MLIQILSDLHVEFDGNPVPPLAPDAEFIVLAGDLAPVHTNRVGGIAKRWTGADRILYVPGNHEFYGSDIEVARHELARQCLEHGVTLLDRGAVTVDDVRFIGATLWTDFRLETSVLGEAWAHHEVGRTLSDFSGSIRDRSAPEGLFTTQESARRHAEGKSVHRDRTREGARCWPHARRHHPPRAEPKVHPALVREEPPEPWIRVKPR